MNWKIIDIEGVKENTFEISNTGIVRYINSKETKAITINGDGYPYIKFYDINRSVNIGLPRLLAIHFIPRTNDDIIYRRNYVHFKDFDKDNISLDNLEWVNSFELNLKTRLWYDNPSKTIDYAEYICKLLERDYDNASICKILSIPQSKFGSIISNIRRRKIYKDISKKYKF